MADIKIDVITRELPDSGRDSDFGRFSGTNDQGRISTTTLPGLGHELDWDWINFHKVTAL